MAQVANHRFPLPLSVRTTPNGVGRGDVIAILVLLFAIAVKATERLVFAEWLRRTDVINQFVPWWSYLGDELRAGNIPGWNPYQIGGTPFVGDPQSGWMYLPTMTAFTLFTPVAAIKAYVVIHLLIAGISLYVFARVIGLGPLPGLVTACAYTLGPFLHHVTYCCNVLAHVEAWIPLGLLGVEIIRRSSTLSHRIAGWGVSGLALSQMFAGSMGQGAYDGVLVVGSYLAHRVLLAPQPSDLQLGTRVRNLVVNGVAVLAVGFGLGAAALLPLVDVNADTNLAGGDYSLVENLEERTGASLDTALTRMIGPAFKNRRTSVGMVTLVLAMIGAVVGLRRPPAPYFIALSVIVPVLTLETTLLHHLFYLLPRFRELHLHNSARTLAAFMIGPAILAGIAVDMLPRLSIRRGLLAALVPAAGIALIALGISSQHRAFLRPREPWMWAVLVVSVLIAALALARGALTNQRALAAARAAVPVLLVVILLWEPSGRDLVDQIRNTPVGERTPAIVSANFDATDGSQAGSYLQQRKAETVEPFRYIGYNAVNLRTRANELGFTYQNRYWSPRYRRLLLGPRSLFLRLYHLQGYNPVQLKRAVELFLMINGQPLDYHDANVLTSGMDSPWLNVLRVVYIVVPPDVPPGRPDLLHLGQRHPTVFNNGLARVLVNESAFPYAWVVHDLQSAGNDEALRLVETGTIDPRLTALLEPGIEVPHAQRPAEGTNEPVTVTRYESDEIRLTAHLEADGLLVLSEIFDPGWHVTVDGRSAQLYLVDGVLRGIAVGAGEHRVELRYAPRSISIGLAISALTALALLAAIVILGRRPRPNPTGGNGSKSSAPAPTRRSKLLRRTKSQWMRLRSVPGCQALFAAVRSQGSKMMSRVVRRVRPLSFDHPAAAARSWHHGVR